MTHLVPVGEGLGIQIPPDLIKAAHLDDASDLFFELTMQGLLIKPPSCATKKGLNISKEFNRLRQGVTLGPETTLKQLMEDGRKW